MISGSHDLFAGLPVERRDDALSPGAMVLRGFASDIASELVQAIAVIAAQAPFRHLVTPGGHTMSVAMTNCGPLGWVSDHRGYRYAGDDPLGGQPWPGMPALFSSLAGHAAAHAGYDGFAPDACLVNRYAPGTRLTLHQDGDERDRRQPIVSVSLGLPAVFLWGGNDRSDRQQRVPLGHGDVVVWGGVSRLRFHGIMPLKPGHHPDTGEFRLNITFRKAG